MADMSFHLTGDAFWRRMERGWKKFRSDWNEPPARSSRQESRTAIIGGNAESAWVAQADEAAVRTTRDMDILLRREDFAQAQAAMEAAGFIYRHVKGTDMFLDGPEAKARDAVHVIFAGERVHPDDAVPAPAVAESEDIDNHRTLKLESRVRMQLLDFRTLNHVHLRDMLDVELIDASWCDRFPPELATRLQLLIDTPNG